MGRQQGHVGNGPLSIEVGLCSDHPLEAICVEEVAHHKTYWNQTFKSMVNALTARHDQKVIFAYIINTLPGRRVIRRKNIINSRLLFD